MITLKKNKKNNTKKLKDLILPNKRINLFITTVLILGIISGSIFLMMSSNQDKASVTAQITTFFTNINTNNIDNGLAFKNSLIINYLFIGFIWVLGLSMIGIIINIFLTYLKGFLVGFSISSIFLTYKYKGILAVILYTFPSQIINIIIISVLSIYSIMFSKNLLQVITSKNNKNNRLMLKKYTVILMLCIIFSFISSLLEVYIFPKLLKLVVKYYL